MARRELSAAQMAVVQAVDSVILREVAGSARISTVRVACSGGADSLALAAGLAWLDAHKPDPLRRSEVMIVDHGLQSGSAEVAAGVAGVVRGLGLPAEVARVDVQVGAEGIEAAARDARYEVLTRGDVDVVLLGHTMDDQAETVLLGLARGSGTRSLAGMPASWNAGPVTLMRPLLSLRRATTRQACADWGLTPWDDPMNDDDRFARVRARRLLPVMDKALGPGIVEALARTAYLARIDADYLDAQVGQNDGPALPVSTVLVAPQALRGRVVRGWLAGLGITELTFERTQAVLALVEDWRGQAGVYLPGGYRVVREKQILRLRAG